MALRFGPAPTTIWVGSPTMPGVAGSSVTASGASLHLSSPWLLMTVPSWVSGRTVTRKRTTAWLASPTRSTPGGAPGERTSSPEAKGAIHPVASHRRTVEPAAPGHVARVARHRVDERGAGRLGAAAVADAKLVLEGLARAGAARR